MTTSLIPPSLAALAVPIAGLKPYPGNARRGNTEAICESIRRHGQFRPIVVNRSDSAVLAGNHTLEAMRRLGAREIAVTWVDVDADEAARINLIDNRLNDQADYDTDALLAQLEALPDLDGTGWDTFDLAELLAESESMTAQPTEGNDAAEARATRRASIKVLLQAPDLAAIERALAATGERGRGDALLALCRAALGPVSAEG